MNPYETPLVESEGLPEAGLARGRTCPACGSRNTGRDDLLRTRPNILFVIVFGWVFLLIRGAFAKRISLCRDCGEVSRYKSAGSWVAMGFLILLAGLVALAMLGADHRQNQPERHFKERRTGTMHPPLPMNAP